MGDGGQSPRRQEMCPIPQLRVLLPAKIAIIAFVVTACLDGAVIFIKSDRATNDGTDDLRSARL